MARNVEIKARLTCRDDLLPLVARLAQHGPTELLQDDTFFVCPNGRLKLREFADGTGELIFYQRPDRPGPKTSFYVRSPVPDPDGLRRLLTLAQGQAGRVRKHRLLFQIGPTRLHLDRVEGLGDFLELEVVLQDDESTATGVATAEALLAELGIPATACLAGAYLDLLTQQSGSF